MARHTVRVAGQVVSGDSVCCLGHEREEGVPRGDVGKRAIETTGPVADHADAGDTSTHLVHRLDDPSRAASDRAGVIDDEHTPSGDELPVVGVDEVVAVRHLLGIDDEQLTVGRGHEVLRHAGNELLAPAFRRHDDLDVLAHELLREEGADEGEVLGVGVDAAWLESQATIFTGPQGLVFLEDVSECLLNQGSLLCWFEELTRSMAPTRPLRVARE